MTIFDSKYVDFIKECELDLQDKFKEFDRIRLVNQYKVLEAMKKNRLSQADFSWSTGYGYGDAGRDKLESIYADIFRTEDALVRPSISSGTHALSLTLQALLLPGDTMLSLCGHPYDTLQEAIGIVGDQKGCLIEVGINYDKLDLKDNKIDYDSIEKKLPGVKLVLIQRSMGYTNRRAFSIGEIKRAIDIIKAYDENIIVMVDNCYGEFTEDKEPSEVGADVTVGSLIKNPGGGIALSGGYICGREDLVERCSIRLTAPGLGKETGLSFGTTRSSLQGLFYAPIVVNNAIKGACLIGKAFEKLGYKTIPTSKDPISDIVQAIELKDPEKVIAFCETVQKWGPVDSFVTPYPSEMPGYEDKIIMAAAGFVAGSSIEISADGPLREPYIVFYQGGVSYDECKFALIDILDEFEKREFL